MSHSTREARDEIQRLCHSRQPEAALQFARELEGHPFETEQLLAITEIEAGELLGDRDVIAAGVARLESLEETTAAPLFAYNKANGLLAMWQLAVSDLGVAAALAAHRSDLQRARDLFASVGADEAAGESTRCQALVNLGNSMDSAGRYIDAIHAYDAALVIDASFAMAHGNRGQTFLHRAAIDENHRHALACEAVASFDAALRRPDDVIAHGGPSALDSFRTQRAAIDGTPTHSHDHGPLQDPYLRWCKDQELFVHSSHPCIGPDTSVLDSLSLGGMLIGIDEASQQRLRTLQDATNALLRDFISVRYLAWACIEPESTVRTHAAQVSSHASFYDTLSYGRWGVATGLAVTFLAAATNLLDKIASIVHLYLGTARDPNYVYFRGFYLQPAKKKQAAQPDPAIAAELDVPNLGLLALCDLAGELERPTPLEALIRRRHAATHRGIVVHDMLIEDIDDSGWLERVEMTDLRAAVMEQLVRARAALLYLGDVINRRERRHQPDGPIITLPSWPAVPEQADEYW